jgi:hypothetical protein
LHQDSRGRERRSPEIARESEPFIGRRTCVARSSLSGIRTSGFREGSPSTSRVAKSRENRDRPFKKDKWQRSRDLANSEVRKVRAQELGALSRERITAIHLRRTGGSNREVGEVPKRSRIRVSRTRKFESSQRMFVG